MAHRHKFKVEAPAQRQDSKRIAARYDRCADRPCTCLHHISLPLQRLSVELATFAAA
jgi:hypothetical protein